MNNKPVINYPLITKDSKGNEIHYKNSDGTEYWNEYDENNNKIHRKDSNGYEYWYEFDENNNLIHSKNSNGYEYWSEYDENNNLIYCKDSNGYEDFKDWFQNDPSELPIIARHIIEDLKKENKMLWDMIDNVNSALDVSKYYTKT